MADPHRQFGTSDQSSPRQDQRQAWHGPGHGPQLGHGLGPGPSLVLSESILAIAAIADMARLIDPPVSARRRRARATARGRKGPGRDNPVDVLRCRIVWRLVAQLFAMACERDLPEGPARRRPRCHIRQVAMYLSHVVLSVPYAAVGAAFGRDRTTVVHACAVVEDRRDDRAYDRFVEQCERCIEAVFVPFGFDHAEL